LQSRFTRSVTAPAAVENAINVAARSAVAVVGGSLVVIGFNS
jgi:hypothetical protein